MSDNITEVVNFELITDRDASSVDLTIMMRRHPSGIKYFGSEPNPEDLPLDFAIALTSWLGISKE